MDIFRVKKGITSSEQALSDWHKHSYILLSSTLCILILVYIFKAYTTPLLHTYIQRKNELEETLEHLKKEYSKEGAFYKTYIENLTFYKKRHRALLEYLEFIASVIPTDTRLNTLELYNTTLKLTGTAYSSKSLTIFFKRLRYEATRRQDTITEIKKKNNPNKDSSFTLILRLTI